MISTAMIGASTGFVAAPPAASSDLYVSSGSSNIVYQMNGFSSTSLGQLGGATTNAKLSIMSGGDLLISEAVDVERRDPTTPFAINSSYTSPIGQGSGVSSDALGNVYQCSANGQYVNKYVGFSSTLDSSVTLLAANNPRDIDLDASGNLIAAGRSGSNELITRYAGFSATSSASFARIDDGGQPCVAVDNAGNIYQSDSNSNEVHKMVGFSSTLDSTLAITQLSSIGNIALSERLP